MPSHTQLHSPAFFLPNFPKRKISIITPTKLKTEKKQKQRNIGKYPDCVPAPWPQPRTTTITENKKGDSFFPRSFLLHVYRYYTQLSCTPFYVTCEDESGRYYYCPHHLYYYRIARHKPGLFLAASRCSQTSLSAQSCWEGAHCIIRRDNIIITMAFFLVKASREISFWRNTRRKNRSRVTK